MQPIVYNSYFEINIEISHCCPIYDEMTFTGLRLKIKQHFCPCQKKLILKVVFFYQLPLQNALHRGHDTPLTEFVKFARHPSRHFLFAAKKQKCYRRISCVSINGFKDETYRHIDRCRPCKLGICHRFELFVDKQNRNPKMLFPHTLCWILCEKKKDLNFFTANNKSENVIFCQDKQPNTYFFLLLTTFSAFQLKVTSAHISKAIKFSFSEASVCSVTSSAWEF